MKPSLKSEYTIWAFALVTLLLVPPSPAHAGDESFRITVTGGTNGRDRLTMFHNLLLWEVNPRALSEAYIECAECDDLLAGKAVDKLTLYVRRTHFERNLPLLTATFRDTYMESPASDFTMTIDGIPPPSLHSDPSCNLPFCAVRTACAGSGGCSETQNPYPCRKCDSVQGASEANAACSTDEKTKAKAKAKAKAEKE